MKDELLENVKKANKIKKLMAEYLKHSVYLDEYRMTIKRRLKDKSDIHLLNRVVEKRKELAKKIKDDLERLLNDEL